MIHCRLSESDAHGRPVESEGDRLQADLRVVPSNSTINPRKWCRSCYEEEH